MDNENGKVKFKVGVFTHKGQRMVLQIYKRTKCYIWIQFKGHPNCPDVYKRKINENNERSEWLIFLGGWVSADRLKPSVFDGIDHSKGCFTTQGITTRELNHQLLLHDLHKYFYYNQYNEDKPYYRAADMLVDAEGEEYVMFYDE